MFLLPPQQHTVQDLESVRLNIFGSRNYFYFASISILFVICSYKTSPGYWKIQKVLISCGLLLPEWKLVSGHILLPVSRNLMVSDLNSCSMAYVCLPDRNSQVGIYTPPPLSLARMLSLSHTHPNQNKHNHPSPHSHTN